MLENDWCGPYISGGGFSSRGSVANTVPARNGLQQVCRDHDIAYATGKDRKLADEAFYRATRNNRHGPLGTLFGNLVGLQGFLRSPSVIASAKSELASLRREELKKDMPRRKASGGRKRRSNGRLKNLSSGSMPNMTRGNANTRARSSNTSLRRSNVAAPVAFGTGLSLEPPTVTRGRNGVIVRGTEFVGSASAVPTLNVTAAAWDLVNIVHLNPNYFSTARLGLFTLLYSKFRFTKVILNYVTTVGTSTVGNVLVEYQPNFGETCRLWSATTFLNQVMGSGGATLMPIWENFRTVIPVESSDLKYIVPDSSSNIRDQSNGDIYIYELVGAASTNPGYFLIEYEVELSSPLYTPRPNALPYADTQSWERGTLHDNISAGGDPVKMNLDSGLTIVKGAVYKCVLDFRNSENENGAAASIPIVSTLWADSVNSVMTDGDLVLQDGFTFFTAWDYTATPNAFVYLNLEQALVSSTTHVVYNNAAVVAGSTNYYKVWMIMVRNGGPQLKAT